MHIIIIIFIVIDTKFDGLIVLSKIAAWLRKSKTRKIIRTRSRRT